MSHQLRAVLAKPNVDTVVAALRDDTAAGDGLFRIAAGFGSTSVRVEVAVNGRPHVFPAPERVPALLELLFARLDTMFQLSTRPDVDVDIAAFAIWGLTAIHPFDNANGRTSVAFAQLLLAQRWSLSSLPMALPDDAHTRLAPLMMELDVAEADVSVRGQLRSAERVERRLRTTRLEDIPSVPGLARTSTALRAAVLPAIALKVGLPSSSTS